MRELLTGPWRDWLGLAVSGAVALAYELRSRQLARRSPDAFARGRHARLRAQWVELLAKQPGTELLGVQTLRNSLMSATLLASTSAVAFMGVISLTQRWVAVPDGGALDVTPRLVVVALLLLALFVAHLVAAIAMRYFNHAGFMVSLPAASELRQSLLPQTCAYLERAGHLYGVSIRSFFFLLPLATGLLSPAWMPLPTLLALYALTVFDRVPGAPPSREG